MKVLLAVLLTLLLCRQPAGVYRHPYAARERAAQDEDNDDDNDDDDDDDNDDDNDKDNDEELGSGKDNKEDKEGQLQCYFCQSLHREEGCNKTQSCSISETFCIMFITQGDTGSGPLTTYSMWCADTCKPFTKKVEETLMTTTCCQSTLCNSPPGQGLPISGAGGHQGYPGTVAAALLLSLLSGLQAMAS